jgi:hypothetical protein
MLIWHERLLYPEEAGKARPKKASVGGVAAAAGSGSDGEGSEGSGSGSGVEDAGRSSVAQLTDRFRGLLTGWRA